MKRISLFLVLLASLHLHAQELSFARKMVDTLASPPFWGRGYTNNGMAKAAKFLADQFELFGLQPMSGKSFYQEFEHPVNTFPGNMELSIDGHDLVPGKDFIVAPESKFVKGKGRFEQIDSLNFLNNEYRLLLKLEDKLTWSVATNQADYTAILINKKITTKPSSFKVNIENKFVENFKAANICGWIKGTKNPDSVILITAHYDHLGGMGEKTYFPGANDNASGVALLLNLAKYYAQHPQPYTMAFILFAGEEAGLIGSKYFTQHSLIDLKKIRFMLNTDLAGTGVDGITVVNATEFPNEFELLKKVNEEGKLLTAINARGKAANSDHYFFSENGVHAFFFYTLGGIAAYHDVFDKAETLPLTEHEDLFKLLVGFCNALMKN